MPASTTKLLNTIRQQAQQHHASLRPLVDSHIATHPGLAMALDYVCTVLDDLTEMIDSALQLIPSDPHSPPGIPAWDLPETEL